jgi:hypothetical protein
MYKSRGTPTAPTAVLANDRLGIIEFSGYDGAAYNTASPAMIFGYAAENWSSTNHGSTLQIRTVASGAGGTLTDRMQISSNGSVLIGTTTDGLTANGSLRVAQDFKHEGTLFGVFGAAVAGQPAGSTDVVAGLVTLGLRGATSNPPLNLGTGQITSGIIAASGAITSSGGGVGYAVGSGSVVTQATSRTTGVTMNKLCGNLTMFSSAVAAQASSTFTFTNSFIAATDYLMVQHISATNGGAWAISTVAGAGSATITVRNLSTASITEATPLRWSIIKGTIT